MVQERFRGKVVAEGLLRSNNFIGGATFTVGSESSDIINIAVQLEDENGGDIAFAGQLPWWLSTDSAGQTIASAPSGGIAIGTDGTLIEWTTNVSGLAISESDGDIDVDITDTATISYYLNLGLPNGKIATSGEIAFST